MTDTRRRKLINRLVHPDTVTLLKSLAAELGLSEGRVIDRAVAALAVAESFGPEHLNIRKVCPHSPSCEPNCESLTIADPYPRKSAESFGGEHLRLRDVAPNGLTLIKKPQGVEVQIERIGRKAFDAEYRQHPQPPDAAEVER